MPRIFEISGMHCGGCVSRVAKALARLEPGTTVTLNPPRATLPGDSRDAAALNAVLVPLGDYRASGPVGT